MGSLSKAAIAAYIVFGGLCLHSTAAGTDHGFSPQRAGPCAVILHAEMKHPASRKYVAGPWPRFAKEMLA